MMMMISMCLHFDWFFLPPFLRLLLLRASHSRFLSKALRLARFVHFLAQILSLFLVFLLRGALFLITQYRDVRGREREKIAKKKTTTTNMKNGKKTVECACRWDTKRNKQLRPALLLFGSCDPHTPEFADMWTTRRCSHLTICTIFLLIIGTNWPRSRSVIIYAKCHSKWKKGTSLTWQRRK